MHVCRTLWQLANTSCYLSGNDNFKQTCPGTAVRQVGCFVNISAICSVMYVTYMPEAGSGFLTAHVMPIVLHATTAQGSSDSHISVTFSGHRLLR